MDLHSILDSVPLDELLKTIHKKAKTGSNDVSAYIRAIFQGSDDSNDESEKRRYETFQSSLLLLQIPEVPSAMSSEIVSLLLLKLDSLCTTNLMKIAEFFVDTAHRSENLNTKWLEIFSKVLSCLCVRDSIVYDGTDMSGAELKKNVLISLFNENLSISCTLQIINVLKDIDLTEDEMKLVTDNLLRPMSKIDLGNLPSYVYQLLLLSAKGQRSKILQAIIAYFIKKDAQLLGKAAENEFSEDIIGDETDILYRQTEGTVILMISVGSRHDQGLVKEFTALLKKFLYKPEVILSPFLFASALSLPKNLSTKDELFDSLKKSISISYQLNSKKKYSIWMREIIHSTKNILELIKEAITSSRYGWDHVCQGLVKFGFSIIDTFGPRYVAGNVSKSVSEEGLQLGSHIIHETFKSHRIVRSDILEQILSKIVTKTAKPVKHYIDLLTKIVQNDPLFHLEVLPKILEVLDYIHLLPHQNAVHVLQALAPLLRISMPLKDTLMLVLRKALFHRDIEARKVAVSGYLLILKKLNSIGKVSLSQSQTSMSSQASSASLISTQVRADVYISSGNPSSRTMCLEIMGLLNRVLIQQGAVRQLLYEGLYDLVLNNKCLKDIILELLFRQFEKYCESNKDADLPLHFNLCLQEQKGALILEEPLAHLITSIHLILQQSEDITDEDEYDFSAEKILENSFHNVTKKLSEIDIASLEISKKDTDEPVTENLLATLILNTYESLFEYSLMQMKDYNTENCEDMLKLYHKYKEISEHVAPKKLKKTPKAKSVTSLSTMHVTLQFFSVILKELFMDATFKHQEGLSLLRNNSAFVMHVIVSCNQKLSKMNENRIGDGFSEAMPDTFDFVVKIADVYYKTLCDGLKFSFSSLEWDEISFHFADGLSHIFSYVSNFHSPSTGKFITKISCDSSLSKSDALKSILKSIQKVVLKILDDTDNDVGLKGIIPLLNIIKILNISFSEEFDENIFKWLKQICKQQVFQNIAISKSFMCLSLTLGPQYPQFLTFLKEIAFDIHFHLDDVDPDEKVKGSPKLKIITPEVARNIISNLVSSLDIVLEEVEYILTYMKVNSTIPDNLLSFLDMQDSTRVNMEAGISNCLSDVILVFHEILQTSVPPDHISTAIFKLTSRLYKIFSNMAKYYLLCNIKSKASVLHPDFEKLVKLTHMKLTPKIYGFISYIQMISEGHGKKKIKTKTNVLAMKAMREIKTVPSLVFAIESYEKDLIIISKKYNRNLMNHMKLSIARDFRIMENAIAPQEEETDRDNETSIHEEELNNSNENAKQITNENISDNEAQESNKKISKQKSKDEVTIVINNNKKSKLNNKVRKPTKAKSPNKSSVVNVERTNTTINPDTIGNSSVKLNGNNKSKLSKKHNKDEHKTPTDTTNNLDTVVNDSISQTINNKSKLSRKRSRDSQKPSKPEDVSTVDKQPNVKRKRLGVRVNKKK